MWEKEKMLVPSIFSFSHSVIYSIMEWNCVFSNLLPANAFNLVKSKILSFGKRVKLIATKTK